MQSRAWLGLCLFSVLIVQQGLLAQTATERSYSEARKLLDAAIQAHGGRAALEAVKSLMVESRGTNFLLGQSLRPDAPLASRGVTIRAVFDFVGRRYAAEMEQVVGGALSRTRVSAGEQGFTSNLVTRVSTALSPGALAGTLANLRRHPARILLTVVGRAETLRSLGRVTEGGRKLEAVTFADSDGSQMALYFDTKTSLLAKLETLSDNPVLGDIATEVFFENYQTFSGVKLPTRQVTRVAGEKTQELDHTIQVDSPGDETLFTPLSELAPAGSPASNVTMTQLAEGVWFVSGTSHNSLLVAFSEFLVVVEAPLSSERSRAVITKIKELLPNRPIKYVVPTHYHYDHSGGLREYIAEGVTVLSPPGNRAFIERMAATPHTLRPDALSARPRTPSVEVFSGKRVISDGMQTLELYDLGPSAHVDEMIMAYLPAEKLIFESDLFTIPMTGPFPPPTAWTKEFAEKLKNLGIAVERIAPGHGRLGTIEDLEKAIGSQPGEDLLR